MLQAMTAANTPTQDQAAPAAAPAAIGAPPSPIYVIAAHPDWRSSRVTARLMATARAAPGVAVNDLYSSYPDYAIDVQTEQQRLMAASLVVMMFPLHWYSMPALLKLWLDDVLAYGWAYGPTRAALEGKYLWLVTSAGGPEASYQPGGYNGHTVDDFLLPWHQTARLCGMRFLPPLVLLSANRASDTVLDEHAEHLDQALRSWPQWAHKADGQGRGRTRVPVSDRPVVDA